MSEGDIMDDPMFNWHPWFAWHLVEVNGKTVWLETVFRRENPNWLIKPASHAYGPREWQYGTVLNALRDNK
jgi:hypothetical protein